MRQQGFIRYTRTLALGLVFGSVLGASAHAQPVQLTLGHGEPPGNPRHTAAVKFAELAKQYSNGRITIDIAPSAQLGNDAAMVTAVRTGALDMSVNSLGAVSAVVPEYSAWGLPFLFASSKDAFVVLDGPLGQELMDKSADKGMVVLGYWDNGMRHVTNSKHAIRSVADFKGLKMRTPPDAALVDTMQALGAQAQQLRYSEVYVALQQGVVDGQENPLANIYTAKFYEVQKHLTLTGHVFQMSILMIGKRRWDRLSAEDKNALIRAGRESSLFQRQVFDEFDSGLLSELKAKGMQVETIDINAMVQATESVRAKWLTGPIGAYVRKVVDAAQALRK